MASQLPQVLSVTSGKGGVGKTNVSVNLACQLRKLGHKVLLLDADLGLANVDILLGLTPDKNLFHLLQGEATLKDVLIDTKFGFSILPAASGINEMLTLDTGQKLALLESLDALESSIDFLVVDTGAGINDNVLYFNMAVQERLLVLSTEPTSLTDAYALIKVLKLDHDINRFHVLVNMTSSDMESKEIYAKLHEACDQFLSGISLNLLGNIPKDPMVRDAVIHQAPFSEHDPESTSSVAMQAIAQKVASLPVNKTLDGNIKFFWKKLLLGK